MKHMLFAFSITLACFLTNPVAGQIIMQPNNLFQSPLFLVENRDVQKDLKFSEEQAKKLVELTRAHAEAVRGLSFTPADQEKRKKANADASKGLAALLDADQAKRYKQLVVQQRGASIFGDPQVAKDLGITNEQRGDIVTILQTFNPKWLAIIQGAKGNQQETQKKLGEVHRDLISGVVKKLTPDQQAKWKEIAGPPFAGTFPFMNPVFVDMRPQPTLAWHMNDLAAAQAEARKTGKPIFATFRCEA